MAKMGSARRPAAETPKGFRDYFGNEVTKRTKMLGAIAEVFEAYGFQALETPAVENLDALGKFLPDIDQPNEGVFAWKETPGWLALRYDLTAPLARVAAQHRNSLPSPYRRYAIGPVWRNEKPGPGRYRQFYQCDADTVGSASAASDAEMCMLVCEALESVGIARGEYLVRINNRKLLDGILENAGLSTEEGDATRDTVLRALDKFDRIGVDGVSALLQKGRKDESGDFTRGAELSPDQAAQILEFLDEELDAPSNEPWDMLDEIKLYLDQRSEIGTEGWRELAEIAEMLDAQGFGSDRLKVDPTVVRGLGYYTGPVIEVELTFEIRDEVGRPRRFGSVAGGGRYDGLVERFTGQKVPATGVSIGVDRLLAALEARQGIAAKEVGPVVVTVMDRDRMSEYMKMAGELRSAGIKAEVFLGNARNLGRQMKYADQRNSPIAVIQGDNERTRDKVILKDLVLGLKIASGATLDEWKKHEAQVEVPRSSLVEAASNMLKSSAG